MRKISLYVASFTILAFLSLGIFNPTFAQQKPLGPKGKHHKMHHDMPMKKMMGKEHHSPEHMQMMADPVLKTLHNFGCPGFLLMNADKLGLDEKQQETLTNLKNEFKKAAIKINADIKVATVDMEQAMSKEKPDYDKVQKDINNIEQLKKQLHEIFFNTLKNGRKVLTDDQLEKLQNLTKPGAHKMPMEEMEEEEEEL